jgi:hypothetical protein
LKEKLYLSVSANAVGNTTRWEDGEKGSLESQITEVIIGMLIASEYAHRRWIEEQAAWERKRREEAERAAIRQREEDERRERERLAAIEKAKLDNLLRNAEAWRTARNLRRYIRAVMETTSEYGDSQQLEAWSLWALAEADKLDPLVSKRALPTDQHTDEPEQPLS